VDTALSNVLCNVSGREEHDGHRQVSARGQVKAVGLVVLESDSLKKLRQRERERERRVKGEKADKPSSG